jgi:hypothetical protein
MAAEVKLDAIIEALELADGAAGFFYFCILCFLDRPLTRSERAENFDSG